MDKIYTEGENFQGLTFSKEESARGDYENCNFINCSFSNSDLSQINFIECKFINCDLSMAKVNNTGLQSATFKNYKLLGLILSDCNKFLWSANFEDCIRIKKAKFSMTGIVGLLDKYNLEIR